MARFFSWLSDPKHPFRRAGFCLLISAGNAYGALYVRPNSPLSIFDWIFAIGGALGFLFYTFDALSDYFYGPTEILDNRPSPESARMGSTTQLESTAGKLWKRILAPPHLTSSGVRLNRISPGTN